MTFRPSDAAQPGKRQPSPRKSAGASEAWNRLPVQEQQRLLVAQRLRRVAAQVKQAGSHDAAFFSVAIDAATNTVVVYRVGGADTHAARVYQDIQRGDARIDIRAARLSATQAQDLTQRIKADHQALKQQGIWITHWGGSGRGGPFHIGLRHADKYRAFLLERYGTYGPGTVEVVEEEPTIPFSRDNDSPPYWGGAREPPLPAP